MVDEKIICECCDEWAAEMKDWATKSNNNTGRMAMDCDCSQCKYKQDYDALLEVLKNLREIMERVQRGIVDLKKYGNRTQVSSLS